MDILADALKQGLAPAIVVALYLIIVKIIDNKKENAQIRINDELIKSVNSISAFLTNITKNIIEKDKEKCKVAVEDSMFSSAMRINNFFSNTVINNHIDINKPNILANVHNIVNSEFYTVYSTLSLYNINDKKVSDYMNKSWMEEVEKDIINVMYNESLDVNSKLSTFSNRINFRFQTYITYIINHTIK